MAIFNLQEKSLSLVQHYSTTVWPHCPVAVSSICSILLSSQGRGSVRYPYLYHNHTCTNRKFCVCVSSLANNYGQTEMASCSKVSFEKQSKQAIEGPWFTRQVAETLFRGQLFLKFEKTRLFV